MDPSVFDTVVRTFPSGTRRRLLAALVALPLSGGLAVLSSESGAAESPRDRFKRRQNANRRRRRNRKRQNNGNNNNKNKGGSKLGAANCIPQTTNDQPTDLQQIIDNASPFANIVLCAGEFQADGLQISRNVSLIGAGTTDQKNTTLFGSNPFAPNGSNTNGVLAITAGNVFVSNLVISGANGDVPAVGVAGGEVTLSGVVIERNSAGGIVNEGGALRLTAGTQVIGNGSDAEGGGILHRGGTTTVASGCLIEGNTATDGGGIFDGTGVANDIQLADTFIVTRNTPNNCSPNDSVQNCID